MSTTNIKSIQKDGWVKIIILIVLTTGLGISIYSYLNLSTINEDNLVITELKTDYYSAYLTQTIELDSGFKPNVSPLADGIEKIYENSFETTDNITGTVSLESVIVYNGSKSLHVRTSTGLMNNISISTTESRSIYSDENLDLIGHFYASYSQSWSRKNTKANIVIHCDNSSTHLTMCVILFGGLIVSGNINIDFQSYFSSFGIGMWNTFELLNLKDFSIYCNDSIKINQIDFLIDGPSSAGRLDLYFDDFMIVTKPINTDGSAWVDETQQLVTSYVIQTNYTIYVLQNVVDCDGTTFNSELDLIVQNYIDIDKLKPNVASNVVINWSVYFNTIDVANTFSSIENSSLLIGGTAEDAWKITGNVISNPLPLIYTTSHGTSLRYRLNANFTVYCQLYNINEYAIASLKTLKPITDFTVDAQSPIVVSSLSLENNSVTVESILILLIVIFSIGIVLDLIAILLPYLKKSKCPINYEWQNNKCVLKK